MDRRRPVVWTASAADELDEIRARIDLDDPRAATRLVARVLARVDQLAHFPSSGRRVPELRKERTKYREVIVPPCRVIYRPESGGVLIVHVLRAERRLRRSRVRFR